MNRPADVVMCAAIRSFVFLITALCFADLVCGQSDPYFTAANLRGVVPFGSYQLGDIDNVNLGTGALNIRVQVYSRKGRGVGEGFRLDYSSKRWNLERIYNPLNGSYYYYWTLSQLAGWRAYSPKTGILDYRELDYECEYPPMSGIGYFARVRSNFAFTSSDGQTHRFLNREFTGDVGFICPPDSFSLAVSKSDTGIMELNTQAPWPAYFVRFKNGNKFTVSGTMKDSNGNLGDGRTLVSPSGAVYDSDGVPRAHTWEYPDPPANNATQFPSTSCGGWPVGQLQGPYNAVRPRDVLRLPNGRAFTFTYDTVFGEITRIDLPSGGYIRYEYSTFPQFDNAPVFYGYPAPEPYACEMDSRRVTKRVVSPDGVREFVWLYSYQKISGPTPFVTTVTDPELNVTVHKFAPDGIHEIETEIRQGSTTAVRKVENTWENGFGPVQLTQENSQIFDELNWRIIATKTTMMDVAPNLISRTETTYDSYTFAPFSPSEVYTNTRLNVISKREFAYGNNGTWGPLVRQISFGYLHASSTAHLNAHILDRVTSQAVTDGGGNAAATTTFEYDSTPLTTTSGAAAQHDYTNYSTSNTVRGNVTTISKWRNTSGTWLTTTNWYDDLGNLIKTQDPGGHYTYFEYDDSWTGVTTCQPGGGAARAFPKKIRNHLGHEVVNTYFACSSLVASTKDPNNQTTSFTYSDPFDRLRTESRPDGGSTTWTYDDANNKATRSMTIGNGVSALTTEYFYDATGRTYESRLTSDPQGVTHSKTEFDAFGRPKKTWNATRCFPVETNCGEMTWGVTIFKYDVLGRPTRIIPTDGNEALDTNVVRTEYVGNQTTATDQAGKMRRSFTDALGRIVEVHEPTGGVTSPTAGTGSASVTGTLQSTSGSAAAPGTGSATINGSLQIIQAANATSGTGSVNITGSEQSFEDGYWEEVCVLWDESGGCMDYDWQWVGTTYWDYGGISVTVNGQVKSVNYGSASTGSSLAIALANAINGDSGYPVTASANGTIVILTSKTTGVTSNYPLSATSWTNDPAHFSGPSFAPIPSGTTLTGGQNATPTIYDSGSVWITVNGLTKTVSYGQNSTATTVATDLRNAITNDTNFPVTASGTGAAITLTARITGANTNYSLSAGSSTNQPSNFSQPSFTVTVSGLTLTGGHDTIPATTDSGTAWLTINGFQALVNYGSGSTSASVANSIVSILNTNGASPVTATLNGSTITLTAKITGASTNYSLVAGSTTDYPTIFTQPSFSISTSGSSLTGGSDGTQGSFTVPAVTKYRYDTLDNLICVWQKGTDTTSEPANCLDAPALWRARGFTYDSLSQLTVATNPELGPSNQVNGTITFAYDVDGNLVTKVAPQPNQAGALTVTTTFGYDSLHRPLSRTYSDTTTHTAHFTYDVTSIDGITQLTNTIGRLVKAESKLNTTVKTRTINKYDAMGRIKDQWQCTPSNCAGSWTTWYTAHYDYDFIGSVISQSNPAGFTLTPSYNSAGRVTQVASSLSNQEHPNPLASNFSYFPGGPMQAMTYGNGLKHRVDTNSRLQACRIRLTTTTSSETLCGAPDPTGDFFQMTYGYAFGASNNSNVVSWAATGKQVFARTFMYDQVNRITAMLWLGGKCEYTWSYDTWGNRLTQDATGGTGPCGEHFPTVTLKNRISELAYDSAGNVTSNSGVTYQYDAENRQVSLNTNGSSYVYDANGQRVQKTVGGVTTDFFYDLAGNVAAEKSGTWKQGYVYLDGKLLARYDNSVSPTETFFVHQDHLRSTRLLTRWNQEVIECQDYYPFGELEACTTPTTPNNSNHKFTGQVRDSESGLDYFIARYHASSLGRFSSIDPVVMDNTRKIDPQQLNLYAYVRNNPLRFIDPTGEVISLAQLTNEERDRLIAALEEATGLKLKYDSKTGTLGIVGETKTAGKTSATFRRDLTRAIESKHFYNVVNGEETGAAQYYKGEHWGGTKRNSTIVINFKNVDILEAANPEQITLATFFYHELTHGPLYDAQDALKRPWALDLENKVRLELGLWVREEHRPSRLDGKIVLHFTKSDANGRWKDNVGYPAQHRFVDVTIIFKK